MQCFFRYFALSCSLISFSVLASDIQILGLFKDKVVMTIDGKTKVLKLGEEDSGIKVLSANSQQCELLINGQTQVFTMGSEVNINFAPRESPVVRVAQDSHGLYRTSGMINDHPVNFIIDTGATLVAMNLNQAIALGITYDKKPTMVETAAGKAQAYMTNLQRVSIGGILVYNVPAIIVIGNSPTDVLLGRSFLNRVEMKDNETLLELRQKF